MHASEVTGDYGPLMSGEGVGRWSQPQVELVLGLLSSGRQSPVPLCWAPLLRRATRSKYQDNWMITWSGFQQFYIESGAATHGMQTLHCVGLTSH